MSIQCSQVRPASPLRSQTAAIDAPSSATTSRARSLGPVKSGR
jgi:hypothetical protein